MLPSAYYFRVCKGTEKCPLDDIQGDKIEIKMVYDFCRDRRNPKLKDLKETMFGNKQNKGETEKCQWFDLKNRVCVRSDLQNFFSSCKINIKELEKLR